MNWPWRLAHALCARSRTCSVTSVVCGSVSVEGQSCFVRTVVNHACPTQNIVITVEAK
jgi:hypothetical protein